MAPAHPAKIKFPTLTLPLLQYLNWSTSTSIIIAFNHAWSQPIHLFLHSKRWRFFVLHAFVSAYVSSSTHTAALSNLNALYTFIRLETKPVKSLQLIYHTVSLLIVTETHADYSTTQTLHMYTVSTKVWKVTDTTSGQGERSRSNDVFSRCNSNHEPPTDWNLIHQEVNDMNSLSTRQSRRARLGHIHAPPEVLVREAKPFNFAVDWKPLGLMWKKNNMREKHQHLCICVWNVL